MTINDKLKEFEIKLGYKFNELSLLRIALTHKSYAYERKKIEKDKYNERLEYLGDALLEHVISEYLFNITPYLSEGDMSKKRSEIVCEKSLAESFKNIDSENYLLLGKCELATDGKKKDAIIADSFEAVMGAIYLDSNFENVKTIILNLLDKQIKDVLNGNTNIVDYKTKLQELLQKNGNVDIKYKVISEKGPDHDKIFEIELTLNGKVLSSGIGKSKKIAEQNAAKVAYYEYKK